MAPAELLRRALFHRSADVTVLSPVTDGVLFIGWNGRRGMGLA